MDIPAKGGPVSCPEEAAAKPKKSRKRKADADDSAGPGLTLTEV